jgi:citrate lyase subunit beta/citryl-CoA lyase
MTDDRARSMRTPHRWRTLLITPGDQPDRLSKAFSSGADGVVADLEDSVDVSHKASARASVALALASAPIDGATRVVRVNALSGTGAIGDDLNEIVTPGLDGIMLSKTSGVEDIRALDQMLTRLEHSRNLPEGRIAIIPLIEDSAALRNTYDIARASSRIAAMSFAGAEQGDFMADLGGQWTPDGMALHYAKSRFLVEVRAATSVPAIDGPSMHLHDDLVLESECRISRTLGFDGKVAIHPRQLETIRNIFLPSQAEVERARSMLIALRNARRSGRGVTSSDGVMVDEANARAARRVLERADISEIKFEED